MGTCKARYLAPAFVVLLIVAFVQAATADEVLFFDDFSKNGPMDTEKWAVGDGRRPTCEDGWLMNRAKWIWHSRKTFSGPVSVEFSGVYVTDLPKNQHNQLGFAPAPHGHGADIVVWTLEGDAGAAPKRLVPLRYIGGKGLWKEGFENAINLSKLPDITKPENAVNLRIDWWPGQVARYYLNDKLMIEFTSNVPDATLPVAVRDGTVSFRIGAVKVTALAKDPYTRRMAAAETRIKMIADRYRGLRMVIACPGKEWGIDRQIADELKRAGVEVLAFPDAPDIIGRDRTFGSSDAKRFNMLIFGEAFLTKVGPDPKTGEIPQRIRVQVPVFRRFLQEGGGIWFSSIDEQNWGRTAATLNYILSELELHAEVVPEVVKDNADTVVTFRHSGYTWWAYAWAEILPDPLTEGLKGLWHPSGITASVGSMGVIPIVNLGPEWRVLVRGMPTAASYALDLKKSEMGTALLSTPGTVKSSPVLCAVRQVGKGRVVLWPTWSNFTVTGGSGGMLLDGERKGHASDGAQLIENLLCWLAEPSQGSKTIGQLDPEKDKVPPPRYDVGDMLAKWERPGRKDFSSQFKGLVGAHSALSDGKDSPEAMIAAAKKAGYDFIAFTEDLAHMDEGKWKQLLATCDKVNAEGGAILFNARKKHWESRRKFAEPLSLEFNGVFLSQLPTSGNVLGLGADRHDREMLMWWFDGSAKPKKLVPLRAVGGKEQWRDGYQHAVNLETLPDITKRDNAINLRIDWWPGEKVSYYLNGKQVAEFTTSVPNASVPVYVWDNTVGYRMKSIKVTSLAQKGKVLLLADFSKAKQFDTTKTWRLTGKGAPSVTPMPEFLAYPGLDFLDEAGNRGLIFGHPYWVRDDWWSKDKPGRIKYWHCFTYKSPDKPKKWYPRIIIRSKTNNKRPWNQGLWSFFSPYCYEGGKLVDDSFHEWRRLIGRHVFFLTSSVMAAHTVRSADEVAASAAPGLFQTWVRAENLSRVLHRLRGWAGFTSYISAGPVIEDFKIKAFWPDGEGIDVAVPGSDRALLHILVRADAGLKEVAVYDGEELVQRYLPSGKTFEKFMTFHPESYHAYSLTVTDRRGRQAISWNAWTQIQAHVHRRCGDNWNWMMTGKGARRAPSLSPPKQKFNLLEVTQGWTSQTAQEKRTSQRPLYMCEQGWYSHGGISAAINRFIFPELLVDDKPWEAWYPVMTMDFAAIGRYGFVVTNTVREDYLVRKPAPATIGCYAGPYKVVPSPWPADLKQFALNRRADGATINRYQGKIAFRRKVSRSDGKPIRISLGGTGHPAARTLEVMGADGASQRHDATEGTVAGAIPKDGYVCWYDRDGNGIGGIIALSDGVSYSYTRRSQQCFIERPSPITPGTEITWDVIYVSGTPSTSGVNTQMEDVRQGMGIAGKPTLYHVTPRVGEVTSRKFFLTLAAEDHGFSGRISRTTGKLLPIHLPVMVKGLNPRWDAAVWYRGETHLQFVHYYHDDWGGHTWDAVARYEPRTDEIQYIPVIEGDTGYTQVDTDKQDADVFIGNLLVCNRQEVFLTVITADRGRCVFEANNPTDKALDVIVRPASGFELTGKWRRAVKLAPGACRRITVDMH